MTGVREVDGKWHMLLLFTVHIETKCKKKKKNLQSHWGGINVES